ncbi:MAG: hypothetical protein Q4B28_05220 [bacterium]|nr:hypothetical protein [bacterium]
MATHFEVVDRAGNKLAEYLKRGDPLDQKTKDFVVQNTPQTKNIL